MAFRIKFYHWLMIVHICKCLCAKTLFINILGFKKEQSV